MTTTRYAVVDVPTVGPHKGKITKVWDFDLHFSDAHVLKKRIANKRYSSCPTVLTEAEIKAHPRIGDAELRQPTETEIADLKIDAKKFAGTTKEQEDKLVAELAGEIGKVVDPIVETIYAHAPHLVPVTKRADGAYVTGPPPDGRSVKEHLDDLTAPTPEDLIRRRVHLQTSIDNLKAVKEPMERTEAGRAQMPKHWPLELKRMEDEIEKVDAEIARRSPTKVADLPPLTAEEHASISTKGGLPHVVVDTRETISVNDPADVTIASGAEGDPTKWCFWESEYPEDMIMGPYASEAECRDAVERFYMGGENPFGTGKTPYQITRVTKIKKAATIEEVVGPDR